jgi:hypothetical protein
LCTTTTQTKHEALEENEQHRVYIILIVNWGLF